MGLPYPYHETNREVISALRAFGVRGLLINLFDLQHHELYSKSRKVRGECLKKISETFRNSYQNENYSTFESNNLINKSLTLILQEQ